MSAQRRVRPLRPTAQDREFDELLQEAAELQKKRQRRLVKASIKTRKRRASAA